MRIYKRYKDHKEDHDGTCEMCNNVWPCKVTIAFNDGLKEVPDLVAIDEIQNLLGISRTRVYRLMNNPKFPKAARDVPRGRLYRKDEIENFMENGWNRQPGRPKSEKSQKGMWFKDDDDL